MTLLDVPRSPRQEEEAVPASAVARQLVISTLLGAVAGGWLSWTMTSALLDDAFITLDYARNLAQHGCWCITPGMPSNTATSPLWVGLLAGSMVLVRPIVALFLVTTILLAAISLGGSILSKRFGFSPWAGPLAAFLLALSPLMQSSVGLESLLAVALLVFGSLSLSFKKPMVAGLVAALLVLTRPDLAVTALLLIVLNGRSWCRAAIVAILGLIPWLAISFTAFGTIVPDTLIWKQSQTGGMNGYLFGSAVILFARVWPLITALSLVGGVAGVLATPYLMARTSRAAPVVFLGLGSLLHLVILLVLRVAPYPWYPAPAAGAGLVLLALVSAVPGGAYRRVAAATSVGLIAIGVFYSAQFDFKGSGAPLNYNRATPAQYAAVVGNVPDGAVLETADELGALAFFCADRCSVVDPLSDRGRLAPVLGSRLKDSSVLRTLYFGYRPVLPRAADFIVVLHEGGTPTFSGYGGWSTMAVRKMDS